MDPLSDVCSSLNVKNSETGQVHIGGRWALRFPANGDVTFGSSLKGSYWLSVEGFDKPVWIEEGDCYLIGYRHCYRKSSDPRMEAVDCDSSFVRTGPMLSQSTDVINRFAGECDNAMIGAQFIFDQMEANFLFDLLPPIIHVRASSEAAPMLRSTLYALTHETAALKLGATLMINHLAHILLVQALRTYVASEEHPHGWLGALVDGKIGTALALMHRDVARQWRVDDLASAVGMSRSSFALRFKVLIGLAPLDYWLQWRMRRAGQLLRNCNRTVSSVALAWGYESEKSFAKAFKRVMGCAPSSYRKTAAADAFVTHHRRVA